MRCSAIRVVLARIGVSGLAMRDSFFQVFHALVQMRIFHASGLRVLECFLRMLDTGIRMPFLPVRGGSPRMLHGFIDMFVPGERHAAQHGHTDERPDRSQN
jgi:hypothetical protein